MKLIGFDVETAGVLPEYALQPFRARTGEAWLTSVAWARPSAAGFFNPNGRVKPTLIELRQVLNACSGLGLTIVGWNIAFDIAWLIALGLREEVFACKWLDAMLLKRHIHSRPVYDTKVITPYGLKASVGEQWPERAGYDDGIDFQDQSPEGLANLLKYNKLDAQYALELAEIYLAQLTERQRNAALLEAQCIPMIAETMVEGIRADAAAAEVLDAQLVDTINLSYVKLKMADPVNVTEAVLASPKQLAELLYEQWKLPIPKLTDKGASSTDKEALAILGVDDERAVDVRAYREAMGNRGKFVQGSLTSLAYNGDGNVRPQPKIFGTYTGRLTYSSKQRAKKA